MKDASIRAISKTVKSVGLQSPVRKLLLLAVTIASLAQPVAAHAQSRGPSYLQPHIHSAIDAASLQIPWSSWPAGAQGETGGTIAPSVADNVQKNIFADTTFHQQTYANHGMQAGYLQHAQLALARAKDTVDAYWLGSYYATAQQATGRVGDAVATMRRQGVDGQSCFLDDQANCHMYIFPNLIYAVWSDGIAVGELLILSPTEFFGTIYALASDQQATGRDLKQLLATADATVVAAMGGGVPSSGAPTAPQPAIKMDAITLYRDVRGRLVQTTVLYLHEIVAFIVAFHVSNFGVYSPSGGLEVYVPYGRLQMIQAVKATATKPATTKVVFDGPADFGQEPDGTLAFISLGSIESTTALGKLDLEVKATLGTASDTRSLVFTVKEAPPRAKRATRSRAASA